MSSLTIRKKDFEPVDGLGLRVKGAYRGTITETGPLVSDNYILFNRHFVRKAAQEVAEALAQQSGSHQCRYSQLRARQQLNTLRDAACYEGTLVGHIPAHPVLRVKAEQIAGIRYRTKKQGRWRYVWLDAFQLRLMMELFKAPLSFFCARPDAAVVLKRGTRTVGCMMPASPYTLDVEVTR